eukprot:NODE_413_length_7912_cov_0.917061.p10 type:complete len:110 gc:universal NODE_413_length_7912_cov_0.917061:4334-4663(+)
MGSHNYPHHIHHLDLRMVCIHHDRHHNLFRSGSLWEIFLWLYLFCSWPMPIPICALANRSLAFQLMLDEHPMNSQTQQKQMVIVRVVVQVHRIELVYQISQKVHPSLSL